MGLFKQELYTDSRSARDVMGELLGKLSINKLTLTEDFSDIGDESNGNFRLWVEANEEWNSYTAATIAQFINTKVRVIYSDTNATKQIMEAKLVINNDKFDFTYKNVEGKAFITLIKETDL